MKKLNLIKKMKDSRKRRLMKKVQEKESKVSQLKKVDESLANLTLTNLTLLPKPTQTSKAEKQHFKIEMKLYKMEKKLLKLKEAYYKELEIKKPILTELDKIKEELATIEIVETSLKVKTTTKSIEKQIAKINEILIQIEKNPKTKEYTSSILFAICDYLSHLDVSSKAFRLDSSFQLGKISKKLEDHILSIRNLYLKKIDIAYANKKLKSYTEAYETDVYTVKVTIARTTHKIKVLKDVLWWMNLSKEEQKDRRSDLSFYVADTLGYWLTLLSVVAEIVYLILLLSVMERTFWVGICILVNIAFLLLLFTIAIKVKNYKKIFSYFSIVFGLYCILRIAYIIHGLMGVDLSGVPSIKLLFIYGSNAYMILASIFVGIRSYFKIRHQMIYLSENKITKFQLSK